MGATGGSVVQPRSRSRARRISVLGLAAIGPLLVAACGDSGVDGEPAAASSTTTAPTTEPFRLSADAIFEIEGCLIDQGAWLSTVIAIRPEAGSDGGYTSEQLDAVRERCNLARAHIEAEVPDRSLVERTTERISGRGLILATVFAAVQSGDPLTAIPPDPVTGTQVSESTPDEWAMESREMLDDLKNAG